MMFFSILSIHWLFNLILIRSFRFSILQISFSAQFVEYFLLCNHAVLFDFQSRVILNH